jgi:thioredoxin reductase
MARIVAKGIQSRLGCEVKRIDSNGVVVQVNNGGREIIETDAVVLACGSQSANDLLAALEGKVSELFCVGDAKEPRQIVDAVHEGFDVAFNI